MATVLPRNMPAFDDAFARVQQLVADFQANANFYLSPQYQEQEARHVIPLTRLQSPATTSGTAVVAPRSED